MKIKLLIAVIVIAFSLLVFSLVSVLLKGAGEQKPGVTIVNTDFSKIFPGKSTKDDVIKINGLPSRAETKNGRGYFYYNTKSSDLKDVVVFENGFELYALEHVASEQEISLDAIKALGKYKTYYSSYSPFIWYVFLNRGVAVETDEKEILKILYFVPQQEPEFLGLFKDELGFSKSEPTPEILRP